MFFQHSRRPRDPQRIIEHGVGFVIGPRLADSIKDCAPHDSRLIEIKLRCCGPDVRLINQLLHTADVLRKTCMEQT